MNRKTLSILSLAIAALAAGNALAADAAAGKTREQVRAELAEAQRTGDIVVSGNNSEFKGKKLNEVYAGQYPAKPVVQGKTRAQVVAELEEAQRTGDIYITVGSKHVKANDADSLSFN